MGTTARNAAKCRSSLVYPPDLRVLWPNVGDAAKNASGVVTHVSQSVSTTGENRRACSGSFTEDQLTRDCTFPDRAELLRACHTNSPRGETDHRPSVTLSTFLVLTREVSRQQARPNCCYDRGVHWSRTRSAAAPTTIGSNSGCPGVSSDTMSATMTVTLSLA